MLSINKCDNIVSVIRKNIDYPVFSNILLFDSPVSEKLLLFVICIYLNLNLFNTFHRIKQVTSGKKPLIKINLSQYIYVKYFQRTSII